MSKPLRLGVNVDHVATVRNARGGPRPDPVRAALLAIEAGADGITAHLREDRRHIHDDDMARLKAAISKPLNFEMAATEQMLDIALATSPARRLPRAGEAHRAHDRGRARRRRRRMIISCPMSISLTRGGIRVSLFIEPSPEAIDAAVSIKAPVVELHTGAWCHAVEVGDAALARARIRARRAAAAYAGARGLEVPRRPWPRL